MKMVLSIYQSLNSAYKLAPKVNNLAFDMRYKHIRDDLESRLHRWMVETNDPILHGSIPDAEHQ